MQKNGFVITTAELDNNIVAINFDKNGKNGGYISVKLDDDGVVVDVLNAYGDCVASTWTFYNELEPMEG